MELKLKIKIFIGNCHECTKETIRAFVQLKINLPLIINLRQLFSSQQLFCLSHL